MRYPMHPVTELEPGIYLARVKIKAATIPFFDIPEGIPAEVLVGAELRIWEK